MMREKRKNPSGRNPNTVRSAPGSALHLGDTILTVVRTEGRMKAVKYKRTRPETGATVYLSAQL